MIRDKRLKLNLGCAGRPLAGYVNIDMDTLAEIKKRYPHIKVPQGVKIYQYDIFKLPYRDGEVDEIKADSLLEHLSFAEEPLFLREVKRVLKPGGLFSVSVPDFEDTVRLWLKAEDDWKDFYRNDPEAVRQQHWFGQFSYSMGQRWGYLTASIFGSQNVPGQFHKNCYTKAKIRAMLERLGFRVEKLSTYRWKSDRELMLSVQARRNKDEG
jgi:predicted SAM-dependent methyltransferase